MNPTFAPLKLSNDAELRPHSGTDAAVSQAQTSGFLSFLAALTRAMSGGSQASDDSTKRTEDGSGFSGDAEETADRTRQSTLEAEVSAAGFCSHPAAPTQASSACQGSGNSETETGPAKSNGSSQREPSDGGDSINRSQPGADSSGSPLSRNAAASDAKQVSQPTPVEDKSKSIEPARQRPRIEPSGAKHNGGLKASDSDARYSEPQTQKQAEELSISTNLKSGDRATVPLVSSRSSDATSRVPPRAVPTEADASADPDAQSSQPGGSGGEARENARGMSGALQVQQMKSTVNRNENSLLGLQELPVGQDETGRGERWPDAHNRLGQGPEGTSAMSAIHSATPRLLSTGVEASSQSVIGRIAAVEELLSAELKVFRNAKADLLDVVLKPDPRTEIHLQFRQRDGYVEALARCPREHFQSLNTAWPQLQERLSQQGVRLLNLEESGALGGDGSDVLSSGYSERHDDGRSDHEMSSYALDDLPLAGSVTEPLRKKHPQSTPGPKRFFESWA